MLWKIRLYELCFIVKNLLVTRSVRLTAIAKSSRLICSDVSPLLNGTRDTCYYWRSEKRVRAGAGTISLRQVWKAILYDRRSEVLQRMFQDDDKVHLWRELTGEQPFQETGTSEITENLTNCWRARVVRYPRTVVLRTIAKGNSALRVSRDATTMLRVSEWSRPNISPKYSFMGLNNRDCPTAKVCRHFIVLPSLLF